MGNIQESSKFSRFVSNIETRISKLATLEIKTIIGDFEVSEDAQIKVNTNIPNHIISSKINLIDGDMTTYISEELVKEKYGWIRDFHAQKELKGHEIVNGNIKAIISLFDLYRQTKRVKIDETKIDETEFEEGEVG